MWGKDSLEFRPERFKVMRSGSSLGGTPSRTCKRRGWWLGCCDGASGGGRGGGDAHSLAVGGRVDCIITLYQFLLF